MIIKINKKKEQKLTMTSKSLIKPLRDKNLTIREKKNLLFMDNQNLRHSINSTPSARQIYKKTSIKDPPYWSRSLKEDDYKIYRKDKINSKFFENCDFQEDWHYGYQNKTHYLLNGSNEIVGCLNLIFLSIYNDIPIFYLDTIEISRTYRRQGLGSLLVEYVIEEENKNYKNFYVFLLVVTCDQHKLLFFSKLGFIPVKLKKTKIGTHCIMSYPFDDHSEKFCTRMFEYFNWREEKKEFISSDCKYAYNPNPTGLYWCAKKNIYVTGLEKQSCAFYKKEKEIFNEKKFLNFKKIL